MRVVHALGWGSVLAIVLLRLTVGWHFWSEGTKKLAYDKSTGELRVAFSAEPMLRTAVGPLADQVRDSLPNFHQWERLLAVPKSASDAAKDAEARAKWNADYAKRVKAAVDQKETAPVEFAPTGAATAWATRVAADWQAFVDEFKALPGIAEEQKAAADAALARRRQQLADYISSVESDVAEWQHELSRLHDWEAAPEAADVPFEKGRITEKKAETKAASAGWIAQVRDLEAGLFADLRATLTPEQAANSSLVDSVNDTLKDSGERKLHRMNVAVTWLVSGVGALLLLGLLTRLAAAGGIAFLLMVVATQPPWVAGAAPTYNQIVEIAALLVLFAVGAGRWFGLDFFLRALVGKCCGRKETVSP